MRRKAGPKPKPPEKLRSRRITVSFTSAEAARIDALVRALRVETVSQAIRHALDTVWARTGT